MVQGTWAIARLRNYVDRKTLISVYYSMIYSHINYCILSWGCASKSALKPLILQKSAFRWITKSAYHADTKSLFNELKILTINDIHKLEVVKYMHKVWNECETTNFNSFTMLQTISSVGQILKWVAKASTF